MCTFVNHGPRFKVDEDALRIGTVLYAKFAVLSLEELAGSSLECSIVDQLLTGSLSYKESTSKEVLNQVTNLIKILHFSDFHILPARGMIRDEGDPCKKVEKLIEIAREMEIKPAFSIITGDLSQEGTETGYEIVKEYICEIEALGGPVLVAVGNVDGRANFRRILLGESDVDDNKPCYYSRAVGGVHVIVLDSQVPGTEDGAFDNEQLEWLEREVHDTSMPCLIAFHHPITVTKFNTDHARRFRQIVSEANILAVLCGHLHQSRFAFDDGICYVTGSGALSEIEVREKENRVYDSSGFNVLTFCDGTLTVRPVIYSAGRKLINRRPTS